MMTATGFQRPPLEKPPTVSDDFQAVEIYRQAAGIIVEKGFEATSMSEIADAVDLTRGGLFYYIKGKKALLFAIMSFAMDLLESEVLNPARREEEPVDRLATLIGNHVQLVIEEATVMSILVSEQRSLDGTHRGRIRQRQRAYLDFLRDTITAVQHQRDPGSPVDPTVAACTVLGLINWVVRWYQGDGNLERDEIAAQVTHLVLHGLAPRPPAA
jgi:AcrR family transcriptional regulator